MPADATPSFRPMRADDMPHGETMTRAVAWPHRAEDWRFVFDLGFGHVAERDGIIIGTAMGWRFGPSAGALGMIIVAPAAQGLGLGRRLTAMVLHDLGPRTLELHATTAGAPLYTKLGFTPSGMIHQHQGLALPLPPPPETIRPATMSDLATLASFDRQATGFDRATALAALATIGETLILERNAAPAGFATLRRFGRGHQIGPVVAPDPAGAQALIHAFLHARPGSFLRVDVDATADIGPFLAAAGLPRAGAALPMRRGLPPPVRTHPPLRPAQPGPRLTPPLCAPPRSCITGPTTRPGNTAP